MRITAEGNVAFGPASATSTLDVRTYTNTVLARLFNLSTGTTSVGLDVQANSSTQGTAIECSGSSTGLSATATASGSGPIYGVRGNAISTSAGFRSCYGVKGNAQGNSGEYAYGVYGSASGSSTNYAGYFAGNVFTTGTYLPSDRILKYNILPLQNAMSIINLLQPTVYNYKTTEYMKMHLPQGLRYGLIADEVQQVLPGLVTRAVEPAEYENNAGQQGKKISEAVEFNAVNYTEMIPILIAALKEQNQVINGLKKRIEILEKK